MKLNSRRVPTLLAAAFCLVTPSLAAGELPRFPFVPTPEAAVAPPAAVAVVPDAEAAGTRAWSCRDDAGLVAGHGAVEADRLLRLAAALERGRGARRDLLAARETLRRTLDETGLAADGRALFAAAAAWEQLEGAVAAAWEETLPAAGRCTAGPALVERSVALATVMEDADLAAAAAAAASEAILSERLGLLARQGEGTGLSSELRRCFAAMEGAEREAGKWGPHGETLSKILQGHRQFRGLAAALWSDGLAEVAGEVYRDRSRRGVLVEEVLRDSILRLREYAARHHPGVVAAHPTFLDTTGLASDHPRRVAAEAVVRVLGRQLPLLAELYEVRTAREDSFLSDRPAPYREPLLSSWHRLVRLVDLLRDADLSQLERGWAWTEIGRLRDRILSLERLLTHFEQEELAWGPDSSSPPPPAFATAVAEQERLLLEMEAMQAEESVHFAALDRYGGELGRRAHDVLDTLVREASAAIAASRSEPARRALAAIEEPLARWLEQQRQGLELRELWAEVNPALWTAVADTPVSFVRAADSFRPLPALEPVVARAEEARGNLRRISVASTAEAIDQAVLELAVDLGLPLRPEVEAGVLWLAVGSRETSYAVRHPVPALASSFPGRSGAGADGVVVFASAGAGERLGLPTSRVLLASNAQTPFWERPSETPPEWRRGFGARAMAIPNAIRDEIKGSLPVYAVAVPALFIPATTAIALPIFAGTALKDVLFGGIKGLGDMVLTDPRTMRRWKRAASLTKLVSDLKDLAGNAWSGLTKASASGAASALADSTSASFSTADLAKGDDDVPYEERIRIATGMLQAAYDAARSCSPGEWPRIKERLDSASKVDPYRQSRLWKIIGDRVMMLAYSCPDKLAPYGDTDPLAAAIAEIDGAVYGCNTVAAGSKLSQARQLKDVCRCLCRHDFFDELRSYEIRIGVLEKGRALLDAAQESCDSNAAANLAREVMAWADTPGRRFECAPTMRRHAAKVLEWASRPAGEDPAAVLARARREIDACRLAAARSLLDFELPPSRCVQVDPVALYDTRQELLDLIQQRQEDDDQLSLLEADGQDAVTRCDAAAAESVRAALESLRPCAEGSASRKAELVERLRQLLELRPYWRGIDDDLDNARQAAAENRAAEVGVYCAGVRQKAQPARCFADALQECDGLEGPGESAEAGGGATSWDDAMREGDRAASSASTAAQGGGGGDPSGLLTEAVNAYADCRYGEAEALLRRARSLAPGDPRSDHLQGLIAQQRRAEGLFQQAAAARDRDTALSLLRQAEQAAGSARTSPACQIGKIRDAIARLTGASVRDRAVGDRQRAGAAASTLLGDLTRLVRGARPPAGGGASRGSTGGATGGGEGTRAKGSCVVNYLQSPDYGYDSHLVLEAPGTPRGYLVASVPSRVEQAGEVFCSSPIDCARKCLQVPADYRLVGKYPNATAARAEAERLCAN